MTVDPPGTAARRGALRLLLAVLGRGTALEAAMDSALSDLKLVSDRALARNLASAVLRWQVDLDVLIDSGNAQTAARRRPRAACPAHCDGWAAGAEDAAACRGVDGAAAC